VAAERERLRPKTGDAKGGKLTLSGFNGCFVGFYEVKHVLKNIVADQDFSFTGGFAKAAGAVNGIANDRKLKAVGAAHEPVEHLAAMQADAHLAGHVTAGGAEPSFRERGKKSCRGVARFDVDPRYAN